MLRTIAGARENDDVKISGMSPRPIRNHYFLYCSNLFNMLYFESAFGYWINFPTYEYLLDHLSVCANKCNQTISSEKEEPSMKSEIRHYQFLPITINIWEKARAYEPKTLFSLVVLL